MVRPLIPSVFLWAGLLFAVAVRAQGLPAEIGAELAVGKNLTGDECKLRRVQSDTWGARAERFLVYCEGWSQPSGQFVISRQDRRSPASWIEETPWARNIVAAGECEAPKEQSLAEGIAAMSRNCLHSLGWRRVMLVAKAGEDAYVADFLPNNAKLIERALLVALGKAQAQASPGQGRQMVALRALEELVGKDATLPSIKEIGNYLEQRNFAQRLLEARHYRKSELAWQPVLATQERLFGLDSPALALTLQYVHAPVFSQRRYADATALLDRAEPMVAKSYDVRLKAYQLIRRAYDAIHKRDLAAAAVLAENAGHMLTDARSHAGYQAEAYYVLASTRYRLKDFAGAEEAARRSMQLRYGTEGEHGVWTNRSRMYLARSLAAQGKAEAAKPYVVQTLASAELMYGRTIWWANAKVVEAEVARAAGDTAGALQAYRAFADVSTQQQFSCYFGSCYNPYIDLLVAQAAVAPGTAQAVLGEAFSVAQLVESPVASTAINQLAARVGAGDSAIGVFAREQQDISERQGRLRAELTTETLKPTNKRVAAKEESIGREIHQLATQLEANELKMQDRFPKYARLVVRKPMAVDRVAALLQPDEGLLYLAQVGDKGYSFLLHQGRLSLHPFDLSREDLAQRVASLRAGLIPDGSEVRAFDTGLAYKLYQELVGPLLANAEDIKRLVIVPSGALLSLPPDVLVSAAPQANVKTAWLARRFSISVVPSVQSLLDLRAAGKGTASASGFLGVGNPKFTAVSARPTPGVKPGNSCETKRDVRGEVARFEPLPESADEVRAMSSALGKRKSTLLLADKATKSGLLRTDLPSQEIIAFATHGLLPADLRCENEPSLAMAPGPVADASDDGLLRASEIAMLRLNASLVILSACNTAGADGQLSGESLSGLVRAFFYAGARNVLATHWPIASQPTVALTTGMIRRQAQGMHWADALRESKLHMMDDPATTHPFYWAAFSLIGGG